ncbi:MAG: hypothetical protein ACI9BK_002692, partial [Acidimicrobiales bacterium]
VIGDKQCVLCGADHTAAKPTTTTQTNPRTSTPTHIEPRT